LLTDKTNKRTAIINKPCAKFGQACARLKYPSGIGFVLWLCIALPVNAGNDNFPVGARSSGVSNASVTLADGWGTFNNQAGLAFINSAIVGFHFENRFLLREFSMQAGTLAIPFKPGTIAASYRYFGYSKYYESKMGLAYGRKFSDYFAAGVQVDYLQTHIAEGYGNYNAVAAEIGFLAKPLKSLLVGFHIFNPTRVKQKSLSEAKVPTVMRFGLGYSFDGKALLLFETEKDIDQKPVYKGGIEIEMLHKLFLRGGYATVYNQYSFGLGYKFKGILADIAFTRHNILGFTPHISLGYEF
jgi:hypothetical protein